MKILLGVTLLAVIHLLILSKIQFTAWPEMLSYPYLFNHGFSLYKDQALPYQPLLILILSKIYAIFGYDINILKIFTWGIILTNDLLVFLISQKLLGKKWVSLIPLIFYAVVQGIAGGNMLWFDLATVPFILGAIFFLILLNSTKKYFVAGILLGLSTLTKQQMLIVPLVLIIYWFISKNFYKIQQLLFGLLMPWVLVLLWVLLQGLFNDYIFWTFIVPFFWYPQFPGYVNWPTNFQILQTAILFSGIFFVFKNFKKWSETTWILFLIFASLFLTAFPRFDFFRMQPAIAVFPILFIAVFKQKMHSVFLIFMALLFIAISFKGINFNSNARFYEKNDFDLARKLENFLKKDDITYFLGVHSGQYILTKTYPSKPWVDNYVWYMEIPGIQDKVVEGLGNNKVEYIFWKKPQTGGWFELGTYQPQKITEYIKTNYTKITEVNGSIEVWQRN